MTNFSQKELSIPFRLLPGYNELFIDYVDNFESVSRYYNFDYRGRDGFSACIERVRDSYTKGRSFHRKELAELLTAQNREFGSGPETFRNISKLNDHNTLAVVTGQQAGILSGPLYTIYKALNTIQLCRKLSAEFPSCSFVPVFWIEADDHDFLEINNLSIIDKENELRTLSYLQGGIEHEKYITPVSRIKLDEHIDSLNDSLTDLLPESEFKGRLLKMISNCYREGEGIVSAFGRFIHELLGDLGLIIIDPSSEDFKHLLMPLFEKALTSSASLSERVINTTVDLENSHIAQVKPKAINLFYIHENSRYLIEPREVGNYALKNSRKRFTREEIFAELNDSPKNFSWNVVTRPLCQDYLLPTVAYIGGPSEVSYFAQFKSAYEMFDITMPVIYPRTSLTLIDGRTANFVEKNNVTFQELFDEKDLSRKLVRKEAERDPEEIFARMKDELVGIFYMYEKELAEIDQNQTAAFAKRNAQFAESLNIAKEKFISAQQRQNEVITGQIKKVQLGVYPDSLLQERLLNITMYYNKYGSELFGRILEEIDISKFEHQLFDLSRRNT